MNVPTLTTLRTKVDELWDDLNHERGFSKQDLLSAANRLVYWITGSYPAGSKAEEAQQNAVGWADDESEIRAIVEQQEPATPEQLKVMKSWFSIGHKFAERLYKPGFIGWMKRNHDGIMAGNRNRTDGESQR